VSAALCITAGQAIAAEQSQETKCTSDLKEAKTRLPVGSIERGWIETGANDGKPMVIRLIASSQELRLEFDKTQEGIWASGRATVCGSIHDRDQTLSLAISSDDIRLGPAAPFLLRMAFKRGARFEITTLKDGEFQVKTTGWSSRFRVGELKSHPPSAAQHASEMKR
jgi:hypothetical protein